MNTAIESGRRVCSHKRSLRLPTGFLYTVLVVSILLLPLAAHSAAEGMELPNFEPKITWKVSSGKLTKVCHNYSEGDWRFRHCRRKAQSLFREKCREHTKQMRRSTGEQRSKARKQKKIFCATFRP